MPSTGILISGDALWENGFGFVMPPGFDPAALPATRATIEMIAGTRGFASSFRATASPSRA